MAHYKQTKRDTNHATIMKAFRDLKCNVRDLAQVGNGVPDLLVCIDWLNVLVEIKDGNRTVSHRKLTPPQVQFFCEWKGLKSVVKNVDDVIELVHRVRVFQSELSILPPFLMVESEVF